MTNETNHPAAPFEPAAAAAHPVPHEATHEHITPLWMLFAVWGVLVFLTILTVAAIQIDLGVLNIWVAVGIATIKAILVALIFMHLLYDRFFNSIIFLVALIFILIFIGGTATDTMQYRKEMIPDYGPALQR